MKNKRKRIIVFASIVIGCVLCGTLIYKTVKVNQKYPQAPIKHIAFGDTYDMEPNIAVTVNNTTWITSKEYIKKYGEDTDVRKDEDARVVYVDITLKNNSNKEEQIELYKFYIEKKGYCNGLALEMFLNLSNTKEVDIELKKGEEYQITLVYVLYGFQFPKQVWKNIENQNFYLVNSRYPVKICWDIAKK